MQTLISAGAAVGASPESSDRAKNAPRDVRASVAGDLLTCGNCHLRIESGQKYCGACGTRLEKSCDKCQSPMAVHEKFCAACGAHTEAPRHSKVDAYRRSLERAVAFIDRHQYADAEITLRAVAKSPDPELDSLIAEGDALRERVVRESEHYARVAKQAAEVAVKRMAECSFREALSSIEKVPQALRGEELGKLHVQATSSLQEMERLDQELRQAIEANRLVSAMSKLRRLHELQPQYDEYRNLASRTAAALHQGAKKLVEQQQYDRALRLLAEVPTFVRTEEVQRLLDRLEEINWCYQQLRESTLATPALLGIADRLQRVLPQEPEIAKSREQLATRLKAGPPESDLAAPDWIAPPEKNSLQLPLRWVAGHPAIRFASAEIAKSWHSCPGQFFTALGLALEGLGCGAIKLQLMPAPQRTGLLGGLTNAFRKSPASMWGLDLGASGIKAIRARVDRSDQAIVIEQCEVIDYSIRVGVVSTEHSDAELRRLLQGLLERHQAQGASVVFGIPGSQVLARSITVPRVSGKKLESMVEYEARGQIPVPLEDLVWDYAELPSDGNVQRIFLLACKKRFVESRLQAVIAAGWKVEGIQAQPIALHHYANYFYGPGLRENESIVWCDFGHAETQVLLSGPRDLWFRSLPIGSQDVTRQLVGDLHLTATDAEHLKRDLLRSRRLHAVGKSLASSVKRLQAELIRSLQIARGHSAGSSPRCIHACGGGARVHGIIHELRGE